ncbi:MAG TPA: translocation/assembly module TamB domain-containing protein [Acetobacteraceae bacterium]|nr:translocation/assembly module TamB domain-containing protein [Acetobacteraceae bacterium]
MRRAAKWIGWVLAALASLPALLLVVANTPPGRAGIAWLTPRLTGDTVRLAGISGRFPDALSVARLELRDPQGDYATAEELILDWSPLQLLHRRLAIDRFEAGQIDAIRMPTGPSSGGLSLPVPVVLRALRVARLNIGPALAGPAIVVAVDGSGTFASPTEFNGSLSVRQLDGAGSYAMTGMADATRLQATLHASEPAHGLFASLAGLSDLGATALDARLDGPRDAVTTRMTLTAGPMHASAGGTLDLEHDAADLTVSAGAPAMQPRADIGWQTVAIDGHVRGPFSGPDAAGRVHIDRLTAAGVRIDGLTADITGNAGRIGLNGEVIGLHVPGPNADLLASNPLTITADAKLGAPDRPLHITLHHRLFTTDADALTGERRRVDATLRLTDLAPFAAMGQVPLQGSLGLTLHAAIDGDTTTLAADGTMAVTGGQPQASALVGDDGRINLAATLHGDDLTLTRLQFSGRAATLEASGKLAAGRADLAWSLTVSDLAAAEPQLGGQLRATGTINGATDDLTMTADIDGSLAVRGMSSGTLSMRVDASGLPMHAGGRITARGDLLGAPVDLAVALRQADDGLAIDIERAAWKSLDVGGALQLPTATMVPTGNLHVAMTRLADLAPLIGQPIGGSVQATLTATPGAVQPALNVRLDAEAVQIGRLGGTLHASASGTVNALDVKLAAALPDLDGASAWLNAAANIDAAAQTMTLASLEADWRQQAVRLLAPTRLGFSDGVAIDRLRLGLRQAVLEVSGRAGATLDLTASLRNLPADLVGADGTVKGDARITGTPARPTGKISLAATGLRLRNGLGRAMPPAAVTADADLAGTDARIDARINAGGSHVSLTGRVPLSTANAISLRAGGALDLALFDPILAAGGRRVRGQVTLDTTITGTMVAPTFGGTARLAGGDVQDFTNGVHLSDIVAQVDGSGTTLRIARFSAKAGPGTIAASGTIGLMAPGLPVDLAITARDAQPLASDLITAVVDADMTLHGEALGQLAATGSVHVRKADIRIPERMPAAIAVLPVNRPGVAPAAPATASAIMLNIALDAPRQVFVRGRGLDVEFGGTMTLSGTVAAPRTVGGFDLRRGTISLAGRSLDFSEGRISFNGGSITDPALHIVASSTSGSITATLTISGTAHDPKITLSSVPPLPQDEVLAQLLFGTGVGKLGALQVAGLAASLATLTGSGGIGDPLDKVRQGLGLDRLAVSNGANGSAALEAGRYIAPRVYLGARQNASGGTQATVQIDIAKGLKLEATAGTGTGSATGADSASNGSSIGLSYQFEY